MARLRRPLLLTALLLALVLGAAVLWRAALVELAAREMLAARGFGEARLEVVEVGLHGLAVEGLALGPGLPSVRRLRLDYAPGGLVAGRLGTLRLEGLRYRLPADIGATPALLPGLPATGDAGAGAQAGGPLPARVEIADAVITLAAPEGRVRADGTLDLAGARPSADMRLDLRLGPATGALRLTSDALGAGGALRLDGSATADLAGLAPPGAAGTPFTGGHLALALDGTLRLPEGGADWHSLDAALGSEGMLALAGTLALEGLEGADLPGTLTAEIDWRLTAGGGRLTLALPRPARATLAGLPPELLAALGFEAQAGDLSAELAPAAPLLAWSPAGAGGVAELAADLTLALGPARLALAAAARAPHDIAGALAGPAKLALDLRLAGLPMAGAGAEARLTAAEGTLAGNLAPDGALELAGPVSLDAVGLATAGLRAEGADARGRVTLTRRPGSWRLVAAPGFEAVLKRAGLPGGIEVTEPMTLAPERLALEGGGGTARLDLRSGFGPVAGTVGAADPVMFAEAAGMLDLTALLSETLSGHVAISDGGLTLPARRAAFSDLEARLPLGETGAVTLAGIVRDLSRTTRFAPAQFTLEGRRESARLTLAGDAELPGAPPLPLEAEADLAAGAARLALPPSRLAFRPGGLQPADLIPALAALGVAEGAVRVGAEAALEGGALRTAADITLLDLALSTAAAEIAGLAGRFRLAALAPPASAGPQELTARELVAGVPLSDARARFSLQHGARLRIHEATARLAGGTVAVADTLWDPAATRNRVEVAIRELDLARLLRAWRVEGISGTGRLSGRIPVTLGPEGAVIADGRLAAAGPGVLRVDWGAARERLVSSGEQVALTVRALENFHYDSLSLGVDRPADGALALAVGLEGASPEVLDGHPFRFNITLTGDLEPILAAVREGRRLGAELLRGGLGVR